MLHGLQFAYYCITVGLFFLIADYITKFAVKRYPTHNSVARPCKPRACTWNSD